MAINNWLTPNLMALFHSVGNDELMHFTMCWRFMYFATVFRPEYFVILMPGNVAMNELCFVFFIRKVMFFADTIYANPLFISKTHHFSCFFTLHF